MPVRSLTSSVIVWPTREEVLAALSSWAPVLAERDRNILAIGVYGSYATASQGVGSDLDLIVIVEDSHLPHERRNLAWPLEDLPVPVDNVVLTRGEWRDLQTRNTRFARMLQHEVLWVWLAPTFEPGTTPGDKLGPR